MKYVRVKYNKKHIRPINNMIINFLYYHISFNIINTCLLEVFGGFGGFSINTISLGTKNICIIDNYKHSCQYIFRKILLIKKKTEYSISVKAVIDNAINVMNHSSYNQYFDIIFLDPSYSIQLSEKFWKNILKIVKKFSIIIYRIKKISNFFLYKKYRYILFNKNILCVFL